MLDLNTIGYALIGIVKEASISHKKHKVMLYIISFSRMSLIMSPCI